MGQRGGARPNAGRKAPAEGVRKNRSIKFNDAEWALVQQYAQEANFKDASEYIRSLALRRKQGDKLK